MSAPWLADALRAGGCKVVEQPGWKTRGTGGRFDPIGVLVHHTAGSCTGNLGSLGIVRDGRAGLSGPLSQLMLARDGVFHVIAAGRANHAGAGSAKWVPNNDGNRYLIGIEAESCGRHADHAWTAAQLAAYPRGVAALLRHMGKTEANVIGHKEWAPSRKIDPAFWDMHAFRADTRGWLRGAVAPEEDIVASIDDLRRVIAEAGLAKGNDLAWTRDQLMSHLGLDPSAAPLGTPEERDAVRVARGNDLAWVRDQLAEAVGFDARQAPSRDYSPEHLAARAPLTRGDIPEIVAAVVAELRKPAA